MCIYWYSVRYLFQHYHMVSLCLQHSGNNSIVCNKVRLDHFSSKSSCLKVESTQDLFIWINSTRSPTRKSFLLQFFLCFLYVLLTFLCCLSCSFSSLVLRNPNTFYCDTSCVKFLIIGILTSNTLSNPSSVAITNVVHPRPITARMITTISIRVRKVISYCYHYMETNTQNNHHLSLRVKP